MSRSCGAIGRKCTKIRLSVTSAPLPTPCALSTLKKIAAELTREPEGVVKEMIAAYYDSKLRVLPRQGEVDMASFNHLLEVLKESGVYDRPLPPAEKFVDLSYAKAAGVQ